MKRSSIIAGSFTLLYLIFYLVFFILPCKSTGLFIADCKWLNARVSLFFIAAILTAMGLFYILFKHKKIRSKFLLFILYALFAFASFITIAGAIFAIIYILQIVKQ